jgi:predicted amidophosphoribosyltransferase
METKQTVTSGGVTSSTITFTTPKPWKFCPECGKKLTEGWKFCPDCGEKLNAAPVAQWHQHCIDPKFYVPVKPYTFPPGTILG